MVCVMVPMVGADGVVGCALMVAEAEAREVHPTALEDLTENDQYEIVEITPYAF